MLRRVSFIHPVWTAKRRFAMRTSALVCVSLLLVSCSQAPTVPTAATGTTSPAVLTASASQSWLRSSLPVDNVVYCECLGEDVHWVGEFAFQFHEVTSGSGNYQYFWQALPITPKSAPFSAHGETSGKVFAAKSGSPVVETFHLGPGEVHTMVDKETYVAEDGSRLLVTYQIHVTTNANGELVVSKLVPWAIA
jgi:hypothetical protein